jgi:hypothetical protein
MPRLEEWLPMTGNGQDRTRLTDPLAIFLNDGAVTARSPGEPQSEASTSFDGTE